jgi:release factor glutamine methyltransferase
VNQLSYLSLVREKLLSLHGPDETEALGRILIDHLSRNHQLPVDASAEWAMKPSEHALHLLQAIITGRPIQYILNEAWFDNRNFWVDESVLIPRPETEELFDWIKRRYASSKNPAFILDIGTGSGILPISLKRQFPESTVQALDISAPALKVARRNADQFYTQIDLIEMNFTDPAQRSKLPIYDLIVSNPPYIAWEEKFTMPAWVTEHEPHVALFAPNEDPLLFYQCIAGFGRSHLNPGGQIFVEFHEDRSEATKEVFDQSGYKSELRKDMQGKWRMLRAETN